MKLKVKRMHKDSVMPTKAHDSDSGFDITAVSVKHTGEHIEYGTGLSVGIPEGYDVKIFPRGSISKTDLLLCNSVGVVDQNYTGEMTCRFKVIPQVTTDQDGNYIIKNKIPRIYQVGDKIAQIVLQKREQVELEEVGHLEETDRGSKAYGSTEAKQLA